MVEIHIGTCSLVRLPIAMAAVYVPTPRLGDDSLTDFQHGLLDSAKAHEPRRRTPGDRRHDLDRSDCECAVGDARTVDDSRASSGHTLVAHEACCRHGAVRGDGVLRAVSPAYRGVTGKDRNGQDRKGANLYSSSLVAVDSRTTVASR